MHDVPYGVEEHGEQGRTRHGSPTFYELLQEAAETHDKKSHDYASDSNPSGNYHFAGEMAGMFSYSPQDAGFVGRIAEKLYRIKNLESSGKIGITENLEDTERDIFTIVGLWISDRRDRRRKKLAAIQRIQEKMKAGEWSGLSTTPEVPKDREYDLTTEQQHQVFDELFPLLHKLSNLHIQQTIDYMSRLLSDRRVGSEKNQSDRLNPSQSKRYEEKTGEDRIRR